MLAAVNQYMVEMRDSGYSEQYRRDTLVNTMRGYRRKVEEADKGGIPLYREGHEGERERHMWKLKAKANWFNKKKRTNARIVEENEKGYTKTNKSVPWRNGTRLASRDDREVEGVIFVPHTQSSSLQKVLQHREYRVTKAFGMRRTKYVERGGVTLKDLLVNKNPWQELNGGCGRQDCHLCLSQQGKGTSGRREGVCYRMECLQCENGGEGTHKTWYIGESSRSAFERLSEHMWLFRHRKEGDQEKQEASSALWRHSRDAHNGALEEKDWKSSITSTHIGALGRQVTEAMSIASGQPGVVLLNSKHKFGANLVNEVVILRGGQVLGVRKDKRKKEEDGLAEGGYAVPPPKRRRPSSQDIVGGEAYK